MAEKPDSGSPQLPKEGKLTMDHLSEVLIHSWHLRSRWDYIGLELGVDAGTLDSIKKINPDDPDAWFIGMFQQWLQSTKPDPTLAQLDKALNAKSVVGDTGTTTREPDVNMVEKRKRTPPTKGIKLKLVNKMGVKEVEWKEHAKDIKEIYSVCIYTTESNKEIPVFIQNDYEIPQLLKVDSKLQFGWQGDFYFFVLHDKERRPFQHRFISTPVKEFFKQASSAIAGIWGAHLETVPEDIIEQYLTQPEEVSTDEEVGDSEQSSTQSEEVSADEEVQDSEQSSTQPEKLSADEDGKLTMDHLMEVLKYGWHLRNRWDYIGLELGIDARTLKSIRETKNDNPNVCFGEMIQQWLQSTHLNPTLAQLDKALKAKCVIVQESGKLPTQSEKLSADKENCILSSGKLSMDCLREVIHYGWSLRSRWYYIGLELGIDAGTLEAIKQSNREKCDDCFQEMIQQWLRNDSPDPTWEQLDKALKAKTVTGGKLSTSKESTDYGSNTGTTTREPDVKTVGVNKQSSPIHFLEGSTLKLVNKKGPKEIEWRQGSIDWKKVYIKCNYTNESNKGIPVFIQEEYEIPQLLKVDSKLQYGWQGDFYFFVLHDKKRRPYQHRFVSTTTKEFFKQASSAIAGVWGAYLKDVRDID